MESLDYWVRLFYTAQETKGSLALVVARTQVVSAFGGQANMSAGLTSPGMDGTGSRFNPAFPATCPFVVSIGGTQLDSGATVNDPESAAYQSFFSVGGFSDIFPMPSYQAAAVTDYLKENPTPYGAAQFNNSGKVTLQI
jgi:hypothetical protein